MNYPKLKPWVSFLDSQDFNLKLSASLRAPAQQKESDSTLSLRDGMEFVELIQQSLDQNDG